MRYIDKFTLTREQSLFLAKKKWDENIYCGMKMENRNVTFPETQTILQGVNVGRVALDDIQAILNMRDAWRYLLDTPDKPLDLAYLCKLNGFVSRNESLEWGSLRTGKVGISGTNYVPPIPDVETAERELTTFAKNDGLFPTEKALDIFLWGTRAQLFWDGNKRTSLLAANKLLVQAGCGVLTVTDPFLQDFNRLLTRYYDDGDGRDLRRFLYDNAISGIEF
jgi:Fic family protein